MDKEITVEVIYAANAIFTTSLSLKQGTTIKEAVELSGVMAKFPEIDLAKNQVGIYGKRKKLDDVFEHEDRIEIYRPLIIDPMEARRRRAEKKSR